MDNTDLLENMQVALFEMGKETATLYEAVQELKLRLSSLELQCRGHFRTSKVCPHNGVHHAKSN